MTHLHRSVAALTVGVLGLFVSSSAHAGLIVAHTGSADPTTEGWTASVGPGGGVSAGSINDGGTPAWFVDDNSTADGSILIYSAAVSAPDIAAGSANGWTLTVILRVPSDENLDIHGSPFIAYRDGVTSWEMNFGLDASGNTVVQLEDSFTPISVGPTHTLPGHDTYNQFDLVYDPSAGTADLFVNGTEVLSNFDGAPLAQSAVLWGAGRSPDSGQGNFNYVAFTTNAAPVPEPSSIAAWLIAGVAAITLRRCRKSWR